MTQRLTIKLSPALEPAASKNEIFNNIIERAKWLKPAYPQQDSPGSDRLLVRVQDVFSKIKPQATSTDAITRLIPNLSLSM